MTKVSVIIPSYNHERFVRQAIESALAQTLGDLEVCVTDDCSTDGTADVVASVRDERIRFKRFGHNRGVSAALNDAIGRSSGEYIAELNSDDYFLPDKLAVQVAFLDTHPEVGAVFAYPQFVGDDGRAIANESTFYGNAFVVENRSNARWLKRLFDGGNCLCHPTSVIRRRCMDEIGLYDERLAQLHDLDLWLRLLCRHAIHVIPQPLLKFRILGGGDNASAPRPETMSRTNWEAERVLRRYLDLDAPLFREVFAAEITALGLAAELAPSLQLAYIAMNTTFLPARRFGLELLYSATPAQAHTARSVADSGSRLIELSGRLDLYSLAPISAMSEEMAKQQRTIAGLEARLARQSAADSEGPHKAGWFTRMRRKP